MVVVVGDPGEDQWGELPGPTVLPGIPKAVQRQWQEWRHSEGPGFLWFCETGCPLQVGSSRKRLSTNTNRSRSAATNTPASVATLSALLGLAANPPGAVAGGATCCGVAGSTLAGLGAIHPTKTKEDWEDA